MSTLAVELHPQAINIECTNSLIIVELVDGRTISAPLVWFPRCFKEDIRYILIILLNLFFINFKLLSNQ